MKTMILATAAVLGIGMGSAYADGGQTPTADTFFTELPGVIAQSQVQPVPGAAAANRSGVTSNTYVTHSASGTWLFPPNQNQGSNS
jgi:hypothetical protein